MSRPLAKLLAGTSAITVSTYLAAMAITIVLVAFTSVGQDLLHNDGPVRIGFFLVGIDTRVRTNLLVGFLLLFSIYIVCFVAGFWSNGGYLSGMRRLLGDSGQRNTPNWFVVMPALSSALLVVVLVLSWVLFALGVPTGNLPPLDWYQFLYDLAYAGPVEETMFRISTLGLLVALRVLWAIAVTPSGGSARTAARLMGLSFLLPDRAKGQAGLPTVATSRLRGIHSSEWAAAIVTSVGFGLAHFEAKIGWDVGKIVTAGLQGFVLALAYLSYGAYASILFHWFFDLYTGTFYAASNLFRGIFPVLEGLVSLWTLAVGIIGIVAVLKWSGVGRRKAAQTPYIVANS